MFGTCPCLPQIARSTVHSRQHGNHAKVFVSLESFGFTWLDPICGRICLWLDSRATRFRDFLQFPVRESAAGVCTKSYHSDGFEWAINILQEAAIYWNLWTLRLCCFFWCFVLQSRTNFPRHQHTERSVTSASEDKHAYHLSNKASMSAASVVQILTPNSLHHFWAYCQSSRHEPTTVRPTLARYWIVRECRPSCQARSNTPILRVPVITS